MLLLLMPEQINNCWEDIKEGMNKALPPGAPDRDQKLLAKILTGIVQVWISYYRGQDEKPIVDGTVLTSIVEDHVHDTRSLLIYALWAADKTHTSTWQEGSAAMVKYAKGRRCSRIIGYTDDETVLGLAKTLGFEAKYTFVTLEIQ